MFDFALETIFYILIFLSLYAQVFFLVTFFENRNNLKIKTQKIKLKYYPKITIIVPCWNEEKTVSKTVHSLMSLNYPQDKLEIFLIDDGSSDNTWKVLQGFKNKPNIKIFHKENGGKHTALNMGIEISSGEYFGCLDADSEADKNSLLKLMEFFEKNKHLSAVCPSIVVKNANTIVQKSQKGEYYMSVFLKKMLGFVGGIHVTPGPLTIFKKEVFDKVGLYRHAHTTEDMEIAYRMQVNFLKIDQCHDALVYTNTPSSIKKLFKQRVRWTYGFLNNTIDYRKYLFNPKYGTFSLFTIPFALLSIFSVFFLLFKSFYELSILIYENFKNLDLIRPVFNNFMFSYPDMFYFNLNMPFILTIVFYSILIFIVWFGKSLVKEKDFSIFHFLYFLILFSFLSPFWLLKATYNTVRAKKPSWR